MLNKIRSFSQTLFAKILLVVMVIPFVFWGMGGSFNAGNSNNIAKIDNYNISTQDFIDYLNSRNLSSEEINKNNMLEQVLSDLISKTLLDLEIKNLNLIFTEKALVKLIKENKNFMDENKNFSRIKYEKFLISNNINATDFEKSLKDRELQRKLFSYIGSAALSPKFMTNKIFKEKSKKIDIGFVNLINFYKKESDFSNKEINDFINENEDNLKKDYIDFSYAKVTPQNLTGSSEFDNNFFEKIDELENKFLNGEEFENLMNELKIEYISKKNYNPDIGEDELGKIIFEKRLEENFQIIDKNDFYLVYKINKINKVLPNIDDSNFRSQIKKILYEKLKFEYNNELLKKINSNKFNDDDFLKLTNSKSVEIEKTQLESINDDKKFNINSIKLLYSMPLNSYTLVNDNNNNIYLTKIIKFYEKDISKMTENFENYQNIGNLKIKNNIFSSYDYFLNNKYKIKINEKTLERVKNYFR